MLQKKKKKLKEALIQDGLTTEAVLKEVMADAHRMGQSVVDTLISRNIITADYYRSLLSRHLGVSSANLEGRSIDTEALNLLPEELARRKRVILFGREPEGALSVAMEDPSDLVAVEFLEQYLKAKIKPYLALEKDLNRGFAVYGRLTAEDFRKLVEENVEASMRSRVTGEEAATEVPIVAIVDNLLSYAVALHASDVHVEIFQDFILIRYRVDGLLREVLRVPKQIQPAILARIKLLGGLKIDEHSKPQDGRYRHEVGGDLIDIRVAVMPTFYGEKVVLRLLPATNKPLSFTELGMFDDIAEVLRDNVTKSYGIVLVTGPTGSGKTTTLYSVLGILNQPEVNVVTIEDPIEYDMKFVNQSQVNVAAGVTFASGLREFLRQDPNIIMVGEIRDPETAGVAIQAALTGHLVLSTLHTNDALTAIPRLIDLEVPPFLLAAIINAIFAQRLVRRICTACIYSFPPSKEMTRAVQSQMKEIKADTAFKMPKLVYAGKGCAVCNHTGYSGRIGIFEIVDVTEEVRRLIVDPDFSLDKLQGVARAQGAITMFEDGVRKIERGMTTIEEVLRVVRE